MTSITRGARHAARAALVGVATTAIVAGGIAQASPAQAWAWDSNVNLSGAIYCPGSIVQGVPESVSWAWAVSDGGSAGWVSVWRSGNTIRYSVPIKVATWGSKVTMNVGCSVAGTRSTSFRVGRPTTGTSSSRDLRWLW